MNLKVVFFIICLVAGYFVQSMDWETLYEDIEKNTYSNIYQLNEFNKRQPKIYCLDSFLAEQDSENNTVLHLMAKSSLWSYEDAIKYIVNNMGISLHYIKNNYGETPLFAAITSGNEYKVKYFNVCSVNETNNLGLTPLHYAIISQNKDLVASLLKLKAKLDIKDDYLHKIPLEWVDFLELIDSIKKFSKMEYAKAPEKTAAMKEFDEFKKKVGKEFKTDTKKLASIKKMICNHPS